MTPKLNMLVMIVLDCGHSVEVLADQVAQYAVACAVQDAHAAHADERGVVNKVHNGLNGLVTTHAAHVNIRFEGHEYDNSE